MVDSWISRNPIDPDRGAKSKVGQDLLIHLQFFSLKVGWL
jgi:hypothetical protein